MRPLLLLHYKEWELMKVLGCEDRVSLLLLELSSMDSDPSSDAVCDVCSPEDNENDSNKKVSREDHSKGQVGVSGLRCRRNLRIMRFERF